jgi:hypothetical protein
MTLVSCHNPECGNTWRFRPKLKSWELKESYSVKYPACGKAVFVRRKRELKQPKEAVG